MGRPRDGRSTGGSGRSPGGGKPPGSGGKASGGGKAPGAGKAGKAGRARAVAAEQLARRRAAERRRRALWSALVAVVVLVAAGIVGVAVYRANSSSDDFAVPRTADRTGVLVGRADAPVTVDVYLDFQCPVCKDFEREAGTTLDDAVAAGTVNVRYHPVAYLDRFSSGTRYSSRSSAASGCAADAGVFPAYLKALYAAQPPENGDGLPDDRLVSLGTAAGATSPAFAACVENGRYAEWTKALTETASKDDVSGTPTVRVDGKRVDATDEALTAAIRGAG